MADIMEPKLTIIRGTHALGRTVGFWSGREILYCKESEPTIHLLDEKVTTRDLTAALQSFVDRQIQGWVSKGFLEKFKMYSDGKEPRKLFQISGIPELECEDFKVGGHVALTAVFKHLEMQGKTADEIASHLASLWIAEHRDMPSRAMNMGTGIPEYISLAKLLLIPWSKIDSSIPAESFIKGLVDIASMNLNVTRFLGPGSASTNLYAQNSGRNAFRSGLTTEEKSVMMRYYLDDLFPDPMRVRDVRTSLLLPHAVGRALAFLSRDKHILISNFLSGRWNTAVRELWMEPECESIFTEKIDISNISAATIISMTMSSTVRSLDDVPANINDLVPLGTTKGGAFWAPLKDLLSTRSMQQPDHPTFDLRPITKGGRKTVEFDKWSPEWLAANGYSQEWIDFADRFIAASDTGLQAKRNRLMGLLEWGSGRFKSPWLIKPTDLRDPTRPNNPDTFFIWLKNEKSNIKNLFRNWNYGNLVFRMVVNTVSVPTYPGYDPDVTNPFKGIKNPFRDARRGNSGKTHRARISTIIHEKMIEVLLDLDENGLPTFNWAKKQSKILKLDPIKGGDWVPSRWTLLALLLLIPLRKKQGRWLDQGLMDEMVFDPNLWQMVPNKHQLKNYQYEDGESHLQRYGRPSGAIQPISDQFMGSSDHLGLYVNTNKTQLWNPTKRAGYELPWPDGRDLMASEDPELQQHGKWLGRVFDVLAYQYQYVEKHDPNPVPISFLECSDDKDIVSEHEHNASRMPHFVPLFRDLSIKAQVERDRVLRTAYLPVSEQKLKYAYVALCMEVEKRLWAEGWKNVKLTNFITASYGSKSGPSSRDPLFDIHCLRVAGISRLIEMDIDPMIVQEFIAGHLTPAMTHRYIKLQPSYVREKIIEAMMNGNFSSSLELYIEKVARGEMNPADFVSAPQFREHIKDLPEDFASFSVVEGGICMMGGKGDPCNSGGVYEQESVVKNEPEIIFGAVRGGCGNCRYFRALPFMLIEQAFYIDQLMYELRALARQRKELRTEIVELKLLIGECDDTKKVNSHINKVTILQARLESLNHNMVPAITEWVNRYLMLKICEDRLSDSGNEKGESLMALVAPFDLPQGLNIDDMKTDIEHTTDVGLAARLVEKGRTLAGCGIPIPENPALMLERSVERLLRMTGSESMLVDIVTKSDRTRASAMIFGLCEDLLGDTESIQDTLDNGTPLPFSEDQSNIINRFATAIVDASRSGQLSIDGVAARCALIADCTEGVC